MSKKGVSQLPDRLCLTAYIEKDPDTNLYVAVVPGVPGAHTQAATLDELRKNLIEVVELCLAEMTPETRHTLPEFVGIQQIEITPDEYASLLQGL